MRHIYQLLIVVATSISVVSACSKVEEDTFRTGTVTASVVEEPGWCTMTKGAPVTATTSISDFGVTVMDGSSVHSSMDFIKATLSGSAWNLASSFRWKSGQELQFYALYPYEMSHATTVRGNLTTPTSSKTTTFTYDIKKYDRATKTLGGDPNLQVDLLFGWYSGKGVVNGEDYQANLKFYHPLAGVQFIAGADLNGVTLKSVGFMDIKTVSTCTVDCSGAEPTFSWSAPTTLCEYTFTANEAYSTGDVIGGESRTLMIIPQTLPATAEVILYTASNSYHASLSGLVLSPGVMYQITLNNGGTTVTSVNEKKYIPWQSK